MANSTGNTRPVGMHRFDLDAAAEDAPLSGREVAGKTGLVRGPMVRRHQGLADLATENPGAGISEDALGGGIELDDRPRFVDGDDRVERRVHDRPGARLVLGEVLLGAPLLADVAHGNDAQRLPGMLDMAEVQLNRDARAVLAQPGRGVGALIASDDALAGDVAIFRGEQVERAHPDQLVRPVTAELDQGAVVIDDPAALQDEHAPRR